MTPLRLFFSFRGRLTRGGFWIVTLTWSAVALILDSAGDVSLARLGANHLADAALILVIAVSAASYLSIGLRRLHDRNKTGWWLLLFCLAPIALEVIADLRALETAAGPVVILNVLWRALALWAVVELGCVRGTIGANRYGADPLAVDAYQSP